MKANKFKEHFLGKCNEKLRKKKKEIILMECQSIKFLEI